MTSIYRHILSRHGESLHSAISVECSRGDVQLTTAAPGAGVGGDQLSAQDNIMFAAHCLYWCLAPDSLVMDAGVLTRCRPGGADHLLIDITHTQV